MLHKHDASLDGTPVGTFGTFAAFVLPDEEHDVRRRRHGGNSADSSLAHRVRLLRNQGMQRRYERMRLWIQYPHDRHPRSDRSRPAQQTPDVGLKQRRENAKALRFRTTREDGPNGSTGSPSRTTNTRSEFRSDGARRRGQSARRSWRELAFTTPHPYTGSLPSTLRLTCRTRRKLQPKFSRCQFTQRCNQQT